jgi:hypothetical protein
MAGRPSQAAAGGWEFLSQDFGVSYDFLMSHGRRWMVPKLRRATAQRGGPNEARGHVAYRAFGANPDTDR